MTENRRLMRPEIRRCLERHGYQHGGKTSQGLDLWLAPFDSWGGTGDGFRRTSDGFRCLP